MLRDEMTTFYIEPAMSVALQSRFESEPLLTSREEAYQSSCAHWHKPTTAAGKRKLAARKAKAKAARKQNATRRRKA